VGKEVMTFTIEYQRVDGQWTPISDFAPSPREWSDEYCKYLRGFSETKYRVVESGRVERVPTSALRGSTCGWSGRPSTWRSRQASRFFFFE
jgi:hypothetical protein